MRRYIFLFIVVVPLVALDQVSKFLINSAFYINRSVEVIPGLLNIVHVRNPGAAFGILREHNTISGVSIFLIISLLAICVILYIYIIEEEHLSWRGFGVCLLLSGTIGNLIDRVRLGEVIDFIDFYYGSFHWPAFNVADSAITTGAFLLIFNLIFTHQSNSNS